MPDSKMTHVRLKQIADKIIERKFELSDFLIEPSSEHWFKITYQKDKDYYYSTHNDQITFTPGPNGNRVHAERISNYNHAIDKISNWLDIIKQNLKAYDDFLVLNNKKKKDEQETLIIKEEKKSSQYSIPKFDLSPAEIAWLKLIYQNYLDDNETPARVLLAKNVEIFPPDFEPKNMDYKLVRNQTSITLLGIRQIDPTSKIFEQFDSVLHTIKNLIKTSTPVTINGSDIVSRLKGISLEEVYRIFGLLGDFGGFYGSLGHSGLKGSSNFKFHIDIGNDDIYRKYLRYDGLEKLIQEYYTSEEKPRAKNRVESEANLSPTESNRIRIVDSEVDGVLDIKIIAEELSKIIIELSKNEKGNMVGIFGRWGRGKSFLMRRIHDYIEMLNDKNPFHFVNFQAWKYQDTQASWAYLYETLAHSYYGEKEIENEINRCKKCGLIFKKLRRQIWLNLSRNRWETLFIVVPILFTVGLNIYWFKHPSDNLFKFLFSSSSVAFLIWILKDLNNKYGSEAKSLIKKYSSKYSMKPLLGAQAEIQKEIKTLLKTWLGKKKLQNRVLLFVDDIDRCKEDRLIEIIDSLRIMLDDEYLSKKIVIVAAIDERHLKRAIKMKFKSVENDFDISEYMDKLFILSLKLGSLSYNDVDEVFDNISKGKVRPEPLQNIDLENNNPDAVANERVEIESSGPDILIEGGNAIYVLEAKSPNDNNKYDLTKEEAKALKNALVYYPDATPRQIRIFYYRYLLARNLLQTFVTETGNLNEWVKTDKSFLPRLILKFTQDAEKKSQAEIKNDIINLGGETIEFDENDTWEIDPNIHYWMINVAEMVVPY
jgi:hypothetical protein